MVRVLSLVAALSVTVAFKVPAADFAGGECVVPPLSCFGEAPIAKFNMNAIESDLSSITFNPSTGTLFAVNNGLAQVYEVSLETYALLNKWTLPGIMDPEGITWLGGRNFAVTDENPSSVGESGATPMDLYGDLRTKYNMTALGDIAPSCSATDEFFLLVKEPRAVHRIELSTGKTLETYAGTLCEGNQLEGLTFYKDPKSGNVRMMVVGEPLQVFVFEAKPGCTDKIGATTGLMATCPVKDYSLMPSCEKVRTGTGLDQSGGCNQRRCDKSLNQHIKICVDTTPGVTDCSLDQCQQHCIDESSFACTQYAYEVAAGECYIFESCIGEAWDADYVQYAMQDPTCERTRADYPLGCEQRRCDKTISKHEKICTKKEPGVTDCSIEKCQAHCETHTGFACTTWAYDVVEKECYIFESCLGEQFDEDYSTYVLIDPSCDKSYANGGCKERKCDAKENVNTQVCAGTASPATPCSLTECEAKCSGARAELNFLCSHFNYDPVDKDCILFSSCINEMFSDDFTVYVSGNTMEPLPTMAADCAADKADGGCPARRCDKKSNTNVKICESPDSACTLDECDAKCQSHTPFACTHYSFDPKAGDCYLWEGCKDESDEADYTTYLVTPTMQAFTTDGSGAPSTSVYVATAVASAATLASIFLL